METELKHIALEHVRENPVALRKVKRDHEDWAGFKASIEVEGILNPINVRVKTDPETGEEYYELIDGLHRYTAAKDLGLQKIPVQVLDKDDESVLFAQLIANASRIQTRPVAYTEQLHRILAQNPTWTKAELARRIGQKEAWITQRFNLLNLTPELAELVDAGSINLANAFALTKLPKDEQGNYCDQAVSLPSSEFVDVVAARCREITAARRKGKNPEPKQFTPIPSQKKYAELRNTYQSMTQGETEIAKRVVETMEAKTPEDGFYAALCWVVNMDPESIAEQRRKYEEAQRKAEETKARKKAEREAAKEAEAANIKADLEAAE